MVDVPYPAQILFPVEYGNVVVAQLLELDCRAYPGESGTHDDRIEGLLGSHGITVAESAATFSPIF